MKYQQKSFTLPTSEKVTQEEWDRIFQNTKNSRFKPEEKSPKDWYAENNDGA